MRFCALLVIGGGLQPLLHHVHSAGNNEAQDPRAPVVSPRARRSRVGASHPLQYLRALQTWTETAHERALRVRQGEHVLECPPPAPCNCHCDCVATKFEKPPPPPPVCPTYYPPYPTKPPEEVVATPYPGLPATTLPPITTTTTTTTTTATHGVPTCAYAEVMRSDGTCHPITEDTVRELKELVRTKKAQLDAAERKYSSNCCVSSEELMGASGNLLYAHDEYRKALDLLLAVLAMMGEESTTTTGTTTGIEGTEFMPGSWPGRPHCEAWTTLNGTHADASECASLCRHQPFCKAFGIDQGSGQCVWFDYTLSGNESKPECFTETSQEFIKLENVTWGDPHKVFGSVEKVHIVSALLDSLLHKADATAAIANDTLTAWDQELNSTIKLALKGTFIFAKKNYTDSIAEAVTVREERAAAVEDALRRLHLDVDEHPPLKEWTTTTSTSTTTTTTTVVTTTTTTTTTTTPPLVLTHWKDFPNSQDSLWAERHPQCPMGPPCFCDCKCHGLPPQNFVEPPPPLPQPCPGPPPMPDPSRYSLPLGAPSLDPRLMLPQDRGIR